MSHKDVDVAGNRKVKKTQYRLWMVITFTDYDNSSRTTDDIEQFNYTEVARYTVKKQHNISILSLIFSDISQARFIGNADEQGVGEVHNKEFINYVLFIISITGAEEHSN